MSQTRSGGGALGEGLWRELYDGCRRHVHEFGRYAGAHDGAAGDWLDDLHAELLRDLEQVRGLAELGQRLEPGPVAGGGPATGAGREIHARLRTTERRLRALADKAGALTVSELPEPDLGDVEAELDGLRAVVTELNASIGPDPAGEAAPPRSGTGPAHDAAPRAAARGAHGPGRVPRRLVIGAVAGGSVALAAYALSRVTGAPEGADRAPAGSVPNRPRAAPFAVPVGAALTRVGDLQIDSVAVTELAGRTIVVIGDNRTAYVWDLAAGRQIVRPLRTEGNSGNPVTAGRLGGKAIALTGDSTTGMQVWDLATGERMGRAIQGADGHTPYSSVAITRLGGKTVAVTLDYRVSYDMRIWDLAAGRQIGKPLEGVYSDERGTFVECSLAVGRLGSTSVALTAMDDDTVRVWDLRARRQAGKPLVGHTGRVKSIGIGQLDGTTIAVTGGLDRTLRIWDLASRDPIGGPLTHPGFVDSVAVGRLGGRTIALAAVYGDGEGIHGWDLRTGRQLGKPLTREQDPEIGSSVAIAQLDGQPVAIVSDADRVRAWKLLPFRP